MAQRPSVNKRTFFYVAGADDADDADDHSLSTISTNMSEETIPTKCKGFHHTEGLSPSVLLAMCVGTDHEIDLEAEPFKSYARKSSLRLSRVALGKEAK